MRAAFFLLALCTILPSIKNHSGRTAPFDNKCEAVLDSAKVLVERGEFSINWQPRIIDKERFESVSGWMEKRSYNELVCLLESPDKLYQMYGYLTAEMLYPDSLKNKYTYLFKDTTSLQYNTAERGLIDTKTTLGAFLKKAAENIAEEHKNFNRRPEVEAKVSSFIKEYSMYPESYKSISFPRFRMNSSTEESLTGYTVYHEYEIKNNKLEMVKVASTFDVDPNLKVTVIGEDSTANGFSVSSKLKDWLREYGRVLSHRDSANLHLR